ncbi:MAG: ComF family protein [Candidatus Omnitrophota bacterium]
MAKFDQKDNLVIPGGVNAPGHNRINPGQKGIFNNLLSGLKDIVYPRICTICKKSLKDTASLDEVICAQCWGQIKKNIPPFCHSCGRHLERNNFIKNICLTCLRQPLYFDRAFSPCAYDGVLKDLIHDFKYKNKDYLGQTLSRLMIEFIKEYNLPLDPLDYIIPMPLYRSRMREREFNQAQVLSEHIAGEFNKEVLDNILVRTRYTRTQTELETQERFMNVKDSFSVTDEDGIRHRNILLVDDVLTTGATSSEAAYALKNAGANIVFVLTLAN